MIRKSALALLVVAPVVIATLVTALINLGTENVLTMVIAVLALFWAAGALVSWTCFFTDMSIRRIDAKVRAAYGR